MYLACRRELMYVDWNAYRTHLLAARTVPYEQPDVVAHVRPRTAHETQLMHRSVYAAMTDAEVVGLLHPLLFFFRSEWAGGQCCYYKTWGVHDPRGVIHCEFHKVGTQA